MSKKSVIFDFNGTLLWDTHLHNAAWDIFLEKHGFWLKDEEKHRRIHGRLNGEILQDLFDNKLTEADIEQYSLEKEHIYQSLCLELDDFSLAEGTVELFDKLKEQGILFMIATASDLVNVEFYIKTLGLCQWFEKDHIVYNDGTARGKPFPDLFLNAFNVLGIEGKDAVIFEDSIAGVKAAEAAEAARIIIVNSNDSDYTDYQDKYPIIKSFKDVDLDWFK
jgi:beta-phosphoglucomutase-like phosphatase (HAD superfamily)